MLSFPGQTPKTRARKIIWWSCFTAMMSFIVYVVLTSALPLFLARLSSAVNNLLNLRLLDEAVDDQNQRLLFGIGPAVNCRAASAPCSSR
jgi:hypothetical protein